MTRARVLAFLIASLTLLAACSGGAVGTRARATEPERPDPKVETVHADASIAATARSASAGVEKFSKRKAMFHVRKLADTIGVRTKGSEGEKRAARYFRDTLKRFGYEVELQRFPVDGLTSRNVVAKWPGSRRYPLVVGAHIDTVPGSPGANDNASGIGALIELARIFKGTEQAAFLTLVAFGSEEYDEARTSHHDGSAHFVSELGSEGRRRLAGMISVDMIADGRPLLVGNSDISGRHEVANTLFRKIDKRNIAVERITLCDCSDHGPFEHAGIDAAFAYSGTEPDYHSPSDVPGNMSAADLLRTGRALRFFLLDLDKAMLDRFRAS